MTDLHFNVIVPVQNFHGFTFKTQKCEAIPAGGDKPSQISNYVLRDSVNKCNKLYHLKNSYYMFILI